MLRCTHTTNTHADDYVYLRFNLLPDVSKCSSGVDVLSVNHMGNFYENLRLSMYESIKDVLLQSLVVILHVFSPAHLERVVAVGENDGR